MNEHTFVKIELTSGIKKTDYHDIVHEYEKEGRELVQIFDLELNNLDLLSILNYP